MMARPRSKHTGLPSYCYRDKRGKLYMLHPAEVDERGKQRMQRRTYKDLDALLSAWRTTWGESAKIGATKVGDLLDGYLTSLARRVSEDDIAKSTVDDYQRRILNLRRVWADVRIEDVDVPMLYRWRDARGQDGKTQANRERSCLYEAFKLAVNAGILPDNPLRFLEPFKEKARTRYVTDIEFNLVYQQATPIVRAAMVLAAVTGLRQGDLLRIRRADFGEEGLTVATSKTGAGLLIKWSEGLRRAVVEAVGTRDFIPLVLLSTEDGKAYTGSGFRTLWHRARKRAMAQAEKEGLKLKPFTFNDLRAKAGSDGRDWQLLGHMDRRTFERIYNRLPRKVAASR